MRYESTNDLPDTVRDVFPQGAQEIYLEVYNKVWDSHTGDSSDNMSRDSVAHRQAWAAVKREYVKDDVTGQWYRQGEKPEPETQQQEDTGILQRLKELV